MSFRLSRCCCTLFQKHINEIKIASIYLQITTTKPIWTKAAWFRKNTLENRDQFSYNIWDLSFEIESVCDYSVSQVITMASSLNLILLLPFCHFLISFCQFSCCILETVFGDFCPRAFEPASISPWSMSISTVPTADKRRPTVLQNVGC